MALLDALQGLLSPCFFARVRICVCVCFLFQEKATHMHARHYHTCSLISFIYLHQPLVFPHLSPAKSTDVASGSELKPGSQRRVCVQEAVKSLPEQLK